MKEIINRASVKLDVVIVSLPLSCSTYVTSAFAAAFERMRRCVVIGVKGSGCRDRCA